MRWTDFYIDCTEWADSTICTRISSLETIGTGDEIVDAVQGFSSEKLKDQLIRKAIRWYYGRGHRHGCQRGGKGNDPKRTTKD